MARMNGKSGTLTFGGTQIHITEWTLDIEAAISDASDSESGDWESHTIGRKKWSGTFKGYLDASSPQTDAAEPGTEAAASLTTNGSQAYSGNATVTRMGVTTPIGPQGGTVEFSGAFTGNGALTLP